MAKEFGTVKPLEYWVQHVLPLVFDDSLSYSEFLAKVCAKLNEMAGSINELPEYIKEQIKALAPDVLAELLSKIIVNVKMPPAGIAPAKGDGATDDTEAFQLCIEYAELNNMCVLIPNGNYMLSPLTSSGNVTVMGLDSKQTTLFLNAGAKAPMLSITGDDFTILGLTLDGRYQAQIRDVTGIKVSGNSPILKDIYIKDFHYGLTVEQTGSAGVCYINNVQFPKMQKGSCSLEGGVYNVNGLVFGEVYVPTYEYVFKASASNSEFLRVVSRGNTTIPVVIVGDNNTVTMDVVSDNVNMQEYSITGVKNNITLKGVENLEVYTRKVSLDSPIVGVNAKDVNVTAAAGVNVITPMVDIHGAVGVSGGGGVVNVADNKITASNVIGGTTVLQGGNEFISNTHGGKSVVLTSIDNGVIKITDEDATLNSGMIEGLRAPVNDNDAANKKYVDENGGGGGGDFVKKTGDTMSGKLIVNSSDGVAVTSGTTYVNAKTNEVTMGNTNGNTVTTVRGANTFINVTGEGANLSLRSSATGAMIVSDSSGTANSGSILGLKAPTTDNEATNKKYVDDAVAGGGGGEFVKKTGDTMSGALVLGNLNGTFSRILPSSNLTVQHNANNYGQLTSSVSDATLTLTTEGKPSSLSSSGGKLSFSSTFPIGGAIAPTLETDVANKKYVDDAVAGGGGGEFVKKTGDTMTGQLVTPSVKTELISSPSGVDLNLRTEGASTIINVRKNTGLGVRVAGLLPPTADDDAANKKYVDDAVAGGGGGEFVKKTGDTMTGDLQVGAGGGVNTLYSNSGLSFSGGAPLATRASGVNYSRGLYKSTSAGDINEIGFTGDNEVTLGSTKANTTVLLKNLSAPVNPSDGANKGYVDASINNVGSGFVKKTGDTLTGPLNFNVLSGLSVRAGYPTSDHIDVSNNKIEFSQNGGIPSLSIDKDSLDFYYNGVIKSTLDSSQLRIGFGATTYASLSAYQSGILQLQSDVGTLILRNVGTPTNNSDAATKKYVDDIVLTLPNNGSSTDNSDKTISVIGPNHTTNQTTAGFNANVLNTGKSVSLGYNGSYLFRSVDENAHEIRFTCKSGIIHFTASDGRYAYFPIIRGLKTPEGDTDAATKGYVDAAIKALTDRIAALEKK